MVITVSNQKAVWERPQHQQRWRQDSQWQVKSSVYRPGSTGNLGFCLGLDTEGGSTILDVLKGDVSIQKAISRTEGIDILPSDITLSSSGLEYNPGEEKESILKMF